jgi:hydrogenase maturation protein HypF
VLSNDRTIRTRADDSVMDFYNGHPYMIRRSRGFAPLPIMLDREVSGTVLAIGGELKNTFAIAKNSLIYPSAYVGDMADIRTVNALEESIKRMETLLEAKPEIVVSDLHPKYNTTTVAESLGLPVLKIQHHYAHILSCMAENSYLDEVIGISFDGTGY